MSGIPSGRYEMWTGDAQGPRQFHGTMEVPGGSLNEQVRPVDTWATASSFESAGAASAASEPEIASDEGDEFHRLILQQLASESAGAASATSAAAVSKYEPLCRDLIAGIPGISMSETDSEVARWMRNLREVKEKEAAAQQASAAAGAVSSVGADSQTSARETVMAARREFLTHTDSFINSAKGALGEMRRLVVREHKSDGIRRLLASAGAGAGVGAGGVYNNPTQVATTTDSATSSTAYASAGGFLPSDALGATEPAAFADQVELDESDDDSSPLGFMAEQLANDPTETASASPISISVEGGAGSTATTARKPPYVIM
jgi:hypothetical protein